MLLVLIFGSIANWKKKKAPSPRQKNWKTEKPITIEISEQNNR